MVETQKMPREAVICGGCEADGVLAELEKISSTRQDNVGELGEPKRRTIIYMCGGCGGIYGRVETKDGEVTLSKFCQYTGSLDVNAILKSAPKEKGPMSGFEYRNNAF